MNNILPSHPLTVAREEIVPSGRSYSPTLMRKRVPEGPASLCNGPQMLGGEVKRRQVDGMFDTSMFTPGPKSSLFQSHPPFSYCPHHKGSTWDPEHIALSDTLLPS